MYLDGCTNGYEHMDFFSLYVLLHVHMQVYCSVLVRDTIVFFDKQSISKPTINKTIVFFDNKTSTVKKYILVSHFVVDEKNQTVLNISCVTALLFVILSIILII